MSFSLFSVIIIMIFAIIAAVEVYRGITRGFEKSLISLGALAVSTVISLIVSPALSGLVVSLVMRRIVRPIKMYQNLIRGYESYDAIIEAIAAAMVSTLFFVLLFFVIRLILSCILSTVIKRKMKPKENDPGFHMAKRSFCYRNNKLFGGIVGAVCAILITTILLSPVLGILSVAKTAMKMAERADSKIWEKARIPEEELDAFRACTNDLPANLLYEMGGKYIYHAVAKTNIYGENAYVLNELETVEGMLEDFLGIYKIIRNPKNATEENFEQIDGLKEGIHELKICHGVLGEHFAYCAGAWLDGKMYFEIRKPSMHKIIEPVFDEVLRVCAETDENTVKQNIETLLNMYKLVLESGIAEIKSNDFNGLIECLEDTDLIDKLDVELAKNPNMREISVSSIAMKLVADKIEAIPYVEEEYVALTESLADAISAVKSRGYGSTEEMVSVLSVNAQKYINDFGIEIPDVIAESAAKEFLNSFDYMSSDITAEQIEELLKGYLQ